jgi:hypothetical protein
MKKALMLAILVGIAYAGYAVAQEHPEHPKKQAADAAAIEATVIGENVCLGCSLKEKGAAAQCGKYGHQHVLKVISATAGGKDLPQMKGWMLHYLPTDNAQEFIAEHDGEKLTLEGKVYGETRVFEVTKTAAGNKPEHPEHPKK